MKKNHFFLLLILFSWADNSWAQGINFEHDTTLTALKLKAKNANKPIFIDCYTTWCGPCKWMAKNVFPNDTVGQFYNQNFICAKLDMEKGDGKNISTKYGIKYYPTLLYLDTSGKEIHRMVGAQRPKDFVETGRKANDPTKQSTALKAAYEKGNRDPEFIHIYITEMMQSGEDVHEAVDWHLYTLTNEQFISKENFKIIERAINFTDHPQFRRYYENRTKFGELVGKERVHNDIRSAMISMFFDSYYSVNDTTEAVDEEKHKLAVKKLKEYNFEGEEEVLDLVMGPYYSAKGDWKNYMLHLKKTMPKSWSDWANLNSRAWEVYEKSDNKEDLQLALSWAKRSMELEENYFNTDTYAHLCYKLNKKKEAKQYAEKAIALAKKDNQDHKVTQNLLDKLK